MLGRHSLKLMGQSFYQDVRKAEDIALKSIKWGLSTNCEKMTY